VEKIVEIVVEKPVIVHKYVERQVERVVEHGADEVTVSRRSVGKASEVQATFVDREAREVEWVERATGEHPDDDIVGDESTVFRASESYVVDPKSDDPRHRR